MPNGDPNNTGNVFEFPLRFPGQYFDRETGLSYNVNRDYWPDGGRYIVSDPMGIRAGVLSACPASGFVQTPLRFLKISPTRINTNHS